MREYCGVSGIILDDQDLFYKMYLTLFSLQHRGQESAGITINDHGDFETYKCDGFVRNLLDKRIKSRAGNGSVGHVRYRTSGDSHISNAQPIFAETNFGPIALAHNGNLVNFKPLRRHLAARGAIFSGDSDSELIIHYLAGLKGSFEDALVETVKTIKGAYSLVMLTEDALWAIRDPHGFRPLVYGEIPGGHMVASETCAIDILDGKVLGEVPAGHILRIGMDGKIEMKSFSSEIIKQHCVFEHIYFARPDSQVFSKNVHKMRYEMGKQLAREYSHIKADIVVAVPDSGVSSAMGFASESGIPMDRGLIRNHYVGRSFIQPTQKERMDLVKMKLRPVLEVIEGKEIALIDDSMVRGTTANAIIKLIKAKNVKKIHYFIASPPIKYSCYFGVDTPDREKLIANRMTPEELAEHFGITSVNYLPVEGLKRILKENANDYCFACFAGNYIMENENG